jgi:hypothetical protein
MGSNKSGQVDMEQVMEMVVVGGKEIMEGSNDFGKSPAKGLTPSKGNIIFSDQKETAINENILQQKGRKAGFMESNKNSHVDMEVAAPSQGNVDTHVSAEFDKLGYTTPVYLLVDSRIEVRPRGGQAKQGNSVSTWKCRARGCLGSSVKLAEQERGNKKRGAKRVEGNGLQGKRGRIASMEDGLALRDEFDGSGMVVAAMQSRRPQ